MRMRIRWLLLLVGLFLIPSTGWAQTGMQPVTFTGPVSGPRPEDGGFYVGINYLYMTTNRTLQNQAVAFRGLFDLDGSISGTPGTWVGSHSVALETSQLMGPGQAQPGWDLFVGWKFQGGVVVELDWRHLTEVRYSAAANIIPPDFNVGNLFQNTFVSSPVSNFTTDWAGAGQKLPFGSTAAVFGIWNAASAMTMDFTQRYDIYQINVRVPIQETERWRTYGLFGPRIAWIWERFNWTTISADVNGNFGPDTTAIYSNVVSNRLYGVHFGFGNDWYLGSTPIGAFAFTCDLEGGMYVDMVKTTVNWNRGDGLVSSGRSGRLSTISPGAEARLGVKWYVWEGISLEAGYDIQTYFNTIASPKPVDFNVSTANPEFDHQFFRWYYGMHFGISFSF